MIDKLVAGTVDKHFKDPLTEPYFKQFTKKDVVESTKMWFNNNFGGPDANRAPSKFLAKIWPVTFLSMQYHMLSEMMKLGAGSVKELGEARMAAWKSYRYA